MLSLAHTGHFPQDGETGQNVAFFFITFGALLLSNGLIFLNCSEILPVGFLNVFVLVLAHLETELELFEVWQIMMLQIIITNDEQRSAS